LLVFFSGAFLDVNYKRSFDTVPAIFDEVNPDFRDGCISICGTPLSSGTFIININTQVNLPVLGNQPYTFIVDLTILPDTTPTFTYMSSNTCDTAWVNFINNNASTNPDIHYSWDFGNGDTSSFASPDSVYYNQPGTYIVNYQQIVDTFPYILERIIVTATDCNDDLFSPAAPDLYLILDSSGTEVINNDFGAFLDDGSDTYAPDTILSGSVELNPLATYTIAVQDDDPFGDDLCGSFTMTTADYTGAPIVYTDGVHTIEVIMTKATDTINYSDTVVVPMCIPVSLSDKIASNLFIVYPNPADNNLNVAYQNDNLNHDAKIEIFTVEGKLVHSELLTSTITTISISDLNSGQYFMKIFNKTNRILQTDQFIKN
jgi:hypothetical protein